MLGEADCIRSLNQKPLVLSTSIKAEMNFGKKKASEFSEGGKGMVREVDEGETGRIKKYASAGKVRGLFRFVSSGDGKVILS